MTNVVDADQLIAEIYEAAVIPENWGRVLGDLQQFGEGALASVVVLDGGRLSFVGTPEAQTLIADYLALGRPDFNSRFGRRMAFKEQGFFADHDLFTDSEMDADPFYQEFLRPKGYGWVAADWIRPPTGQFATVSIERHYKRGPFEAKTIGLLNRMAPHLGRAVLLSIRLSLAQLESQTAILERLGLPAAVLRANGTLIAANESFERLIPDVVRDRRDRLALVHADADALMKDAMSQIANSSVSAQRTVGSVPVRASGEWPAMIFHVLPVSRAAHDILSMGESIVIVTPVDRKAVPSADLLQGLFDLTAAEARAARGIADGHSIDDLAAQLGLSRETIRTQLKAVYAKLGLTGQVDLVALLSGATLPGDLKPRRAG